MQTRRDQLHAYRFQNKRALAALVTGEPNVIEPPMRRLTVITISGIMIAILIAVGAALLGVFKPSSGDKWKDAGAIIVENETGARYVYLDDVLHPVLNYSSAVLAIGNNQDVHVVHVDRGDLKSAKRGATIGIDGIPDSLPSAGSLVSAPWTVCSRQQAGQGNQLDAQVSLLVGQNAGARPLPDRTAVLAQGVTDRKDYLLLHGLRLTVAPSVSTALGLQGAAAVQVGTAFLDAVPAGPPLQAPRVPGAGQPSGVKVGTATALVGQLLHATDNNQYFLVLADGIAALNPVQTALLETLPIGPGGHPIAPISTSETVVLGLRTSQADWPQVSAQLKGLPDQLPSLTSAAGQNGAICAVYPKDATQPTFAVPPSLLPSYTPGAIVESARSQQGRADTVVLAPGRAALAVSADGASTVFVVADPGEKFAATSKAVLAGFGYGNVTPAKVPVELMPLIPTGPALDPAAARRPVTG